MAQIHPSSVVDPQAKLGNNVTIGPFCLVGPHVSIGDNSILHSHVVIDGHTTIGSNNQFYQFSSIGVAPQDLTYKGEPTELIIGNDNVFRECVSIHRGTLKQDGKTIIGSNCLLMAFVHVGHDVVIGNRVILANTTNLAGHVNIGDRVIIGGGTNIAQFMTLGPGAYIGGASAIDRDIPPHCTALGNRVRLKGINIVGLRRQGYKRDQINGAVEFFRAMEISSLSPRAFVEHTELHAEYKDNPIVQEILTAIMKSEVGIAPFMS